jgi:uncharacterized protein DUF2637
MTGDRLIRAATALVVVAVASFAAVVSFSHIYDLGRVHGQSGTAARLLPLSVDGLILAASLVLLHEARNGRAAPALARFALWLGVGGTIAANGAYGWPYGPVGVVLSTWPGAAFVIAVELVMLLVRRARGTVPGTVPEPSAGLNGHGHQAAELFAAELASGKVPGIRKIRKEMHLGQPRAQEVRAYLAGLAESNGHGGDQP